MISKSTILGLFMIGAAIGITLANRYYMREAMSAEDLVIPDNYICVRKNTSAYVPTKHRSHYGASHPAPADSQRKENPNHDR